MLRIRLFGRTELSEDGWENPIALTPRVAELFTWLVLNGPSLHLREKVADTIWGERYCERSRQALRTAIWRLRRELGQARNLIEADQRHVGISDKVGFTTDLHQFRERISDKAVQDVTPTGIRDLERAIALWRGEPLDGIYSDWALLERERLRRMLLNGLHRLMLFFQASHDYRKAVQYGKEILEHDPLREEVHRSLIHLYAEMGDRAQAVRQYRECRDILRRELEIEPMPETQRLYGAIRAETGAEPAQAPAAQAAPGNPANTTLQRAKRECASARAHLRRIELLVDSLGVERAR